MFGTAWMLPGPESNGQPPLVSFTRTRAANGVVEACSIDTGARIRPRGRSKLMAVEPSRVRELLNPSSIAIVGASDTSAWAQGFVKNLSAWSSYKGELHMV